ncbi:IS110 family transposase [Mycolicibacterium sp.]|uniref:IS110 family transposase n=1 Tax=Mycolicibacterium sp. TaxID=2320850 RepID=UPI0037CC3015
MTLPPPAPSGTGLTDYRGMLLAVPVSDHSAAGPTPVVSLPQLSNGKATRLSLVEALFFVGIDWAARVHAVCVLDGNGKKVAAFTIEHTAAGFAKLADRLGKLTDDPGSVPIAIERPDGRLVDVLLEAGHPVVPVKPNAIKTWREGEVLSGAKSDAGDAQVIAEYLRLRAGRLRPAVPYSDDTKAVRTVSRARTDLVGARVAASNQLAALLDNHWPGAKEIFADLASPIALAFLTHYPTPSAAARLGVKRIAAFCAKHGYSGRRSPQALLDRLRAAPAGSTGPALTEALGDAVLAHVRVLTALNTAVKDLDRSVAARLAEHPDGQVFASFPRAGTINAAQILAEWGDARAAYTGPEAIAALAGLVPVTRASGKHRGVSFRWACNKRLRVAITTFADNSRHESPWAADIYKRARASGKDHPHAVRILARSWTRIMWRCWINGTPYDPAHHTGAQPRTADAA